MPQQSIAHDYYYGSEAEQYIFYRFPKALITNDYYAGVSDSAKILYGLMLDRMGLSIKNKWLDGNGRVFIYFTLEDLQDAMRCGHNKGVKIMSELDNIGLIERVKQGQGKPTVIYIKRFISGTSSQNPRVEDGGYSHRYEKNYSQGNPDFPEAEIQTSENGKSRLPHSGSTDFRKADTNKTECSHNNSNDNDPIPSYPANGVQVATRSHGWDHDGITNTVPLHPGQIDVDQCRREVRRRIDYYSWIETSQKVEEQVDEMVELIVETLCSIQPTIQIAGNEYPAELVKARFAKITDKHIGYVMDCLCNNTTHVRNIKKYLLAALFNAPATVEHFVSAEFNHFYIGGGAQKEC